MFTSTPLAGNGLAVVHGADGVADDTMLAFARETRLSETTFVQSGDDEADYRNRIWMPTGELPFAGHPSLGTAVAVARERGESSARYVQRTGAGLQPIEVELAGRVAHASMLQEPAEFRVELDPDAVLGTLGLSPADGPGELAPQVVSTGIPQVVAPVRDVDVLARVRPDPAALAALLEATGAAVVYAAACDTDAAAARARGFFVGVSGEVQEDPATGSAAGPLAAYLHARTGADSLLVDQGVEMGRPSRLETSIEGDRVRVGGETVILAEGTLHL